MDLPLRHNLSNRGIAAGALLLALLFIKTLPSLHADETKAAQFHLRTGRLAVTVKGVVQNSFTVPMVADLEYEIFQRSKSSFLIRMLLGYDNNTTRVPYIYTGVGKRYYVYSTGMEFDSSKQGTRIATVPRWRYYIGGDIGISQVTVTTLGTVLQAQSVMIDMGPNVGIIYQVSKTIGLEVQGGMNGSVGFTSIAVNTISTRLFFGGTYFF